MKATTLRTLGGVMTPLILTGSVQAGFTEISTVSKPNPYGLLVVNVYAEFDRPGVDQMLAVGGTPLDPLTISVIGGTFFQHAEGGDTAPNPALFGQFPSLRYDTFVTIGVKSFNPLNPGDPEGQPADELQFAPGWPGFQADRLSSADAGGKILSWAVTPGTPQGDPFDPTYVAGDGRSLIGQFSAVPDLPGGPLAIAGTMLLQVVSNGTGRQVVVSFFHVPGPGALWLLGAMGLLGSRRRR